MTTPLPAEASMFFSLQLWSTMCKGTGPLWAGQYSGPVSRDILTVQKVLRPDPCIYTKQMDAALVRRFTQRMDLRERSGVTCVNLHFRSVGVTCVNLCSLPQDLYGRKKGQKLAALKITLANAQSVNAQMLENRVRRLASKDLRGVLRQRKRPH